MNRLIAYAYARMLGVFHFLALVVLILFFYAVLSTDNAPMNAAIKTVGAPSALAGDDGRFYLILVGLAVFFVYVFVMGFISTIVSINENLSELRKGMQPQDSAPSRQVVRTAAAEPRIGDIR